MGRVSRFTSRYWSIAIAVAAIAIAVVEAAIGDRPPFGTTVICLAAIVFALARWFTFSTAVVSLAVLSLGVVVAPEQTYTGIAGGFLLVALAAVFGTSRSLRDRLLGLGWMVGGTVAAVLRIPSEVLEADSGGATLGQVLASNVILLTVIWGVAWAVAARSRSASELRLRAARIQEEADRAALQAVVDERARIARELHDVVAHSVSVMTVQAGGVRRLLGVEHAREREALTAIEETGRRALAEMRRMVTVMRDGASDASLAPQPGVATLRRLADEMRDAGLPVELSVTGNEALPAGLDLSVYRIVQEGLTNVLKHAGPARASVKVAVADGSVEVVVEDDGVGPDSSRDGGHGLVGMRERVGVYGGALEAGSKPGGGFRLRALLPFEEGNA